MIHLESVLKAKLIIIKDLLRLPPEKPRIVLFHENIPPEKVLLTDIGVNLQRDARDFREHRQNIILAEIRHLQFLIKDLSFL